MKIKMQIKFLVGMLCLLRSYLCVEDLAYKNMELGVNLLVDVDNDLVSQVVDSISCQELSDAIIFDMFALYQKFQNLIDQAVNQGLVDSTVQDLIRQYKATLAVFYDFQSSDLMSIEWKEKLAYYFFISMDQWLSPEGLKRLMKDEKIQNIIMLIELFGVEITAKKYFMDIITYIHNTCEILKNDDLNDISYEMTINTIYKALAKKFIVTGFTQNAFNMVFGLSLRSIQDKIELKKKGMPANSDKELNNKPIKKKKK